MLKTICIQCPLGCPLEIEETEGKITVRGNTCRRGREYGESEYARPVRIVTTLVRTADGGIVPVKTSAPVPKDAIFAVLGRMRELIAPSDCAIGDAVEINTLGLGADIVVTGSPSQLNART